jgi:hypothetical protein
MLKTIALLCLISYVISPSPCSPTFSCPDNNRCCRGPNGWGCCPGLSATCCSDGVSCCPPSAICDLKNRRCLPKSMFLNFVQESAMLASSNSSFGNKTLEFMEGFANGTNLLAAIPNATVCGSVDPSFVQNVDALVEIARNITPQNWQQLIPQLLNQTTIVFNLSMQQATKCGKAVSESVILVQKLSAHILQDGYITKVLSHAMTSMFEIIGRVNNIADAFKNSKHREAGMHTGLLTITLLLHDFHL